MRIPFALIILGFVIRVLTQALWESVDYPILYYIGVDLFEILMMVAFLQLLSSKWQRSLVNGFIFVAVWDLFNLFGDPYKNDISEHIGTLLSFIIWGIFQIYIFTKNGSTVKP